MFFNLSNEHDKCETAEKRGPSFLDKTDTKTLLKMRCPCKNTITQTNLEVFKRLKFNAVQLSFAVGITIKIIALKLNIHPFMLSRWRKESREGLIVTKKVQLDTELAAELKELRSLKRRYAILQMENDLLKKVIQYASDRDLKSSTSSATSESDSPLP